jgi:hypothetical protein
MRDNRSDRHPRPDPVGASSSGGTGLDSRLRGNDNKRHPRPDPVGASSNGGPRQSSNWIPAFAGMTDATAFF